MCINFIIKEIKVFLSTSHELQVNISFQGLSCYSLTLVFFITEESRNAFAKQSLLEGFTSLSLEGFAVWVSVHLED